MYEQKQCILIADDEERICRALKDLLTAKGLHVLTAGDGRAGAGEGRPRHGRPRGGRRSLKPTPSITSPC